MRSRQPIDGISICSLSLCLAVCAAPCAWSQAEQTVQYPLKLAYIYNVTKFVEWPSEAFGSPDAPVVICIAGHDPFPPDAERELRSRTAGGRPIDLRKMATRDNPGDCHVVFISDSEQKNAAGILTNAENTSALTIGESEGFIKWGGIINLVIQNAKIGFEINIAAAERKRLIISSRLLALAKIVSVRGTR